MKRTRILARLRSLRSLGFTLPPLRAAAADKLEWIEDSHRPLLFGPMARMLGTDGRVVSRLEGALGHVENDVAEPPHRTVSPRRWRRALAVSLALRKRRRAAEDRGTETKPHDPAASRQKTGLTPSSAKSGLAGDL